MLQYVVGMYTTPTNHQPLTNGQVVTPQTGHASIRAPCITQTRMMYSHLYMTQTDHVHSTSYVDQRQQHLNQILDVMSQGKTQILFC